MTALTVNNSNFKDILNFLKDQNGAYLYEIVDFSNSNTSLSKKELKSSLKTLLKKKIITRKKKAYYISKLYKKNLNELIDSFEAPVKPQTNRIMEKTPENDFNYILGEYKYKDYFNKNVLEEAKGFSKEDITKTINHRIDLRDIYTITIDGDDAKDFDDAISVEYDNQFYYLGVHIADVSFFVRSGSSLDQEAFDRGTSVYLIDKVIPMLPEALSNGLCSLVEGQDRLTFSCMMKIDKSGNIIEYNFRESIIKNKKRCTYKNIQSILDKKERADSQLRSLLNHASELARTLKKQRLNNGSIDFETDDQIFQLDDQGDVLSVNIKKRIFSESIIEECMLAANKCAAELFSQHKTGIFRIHEHPKEEKLSIFVKTAKSLGYGIKRDGNQNVYQVLLQSISDQKELEILSHLLLISMKQAEYSAYNEGHYGLGFKNYTHFTSPIRRYPDLITHRLLKSLIKENKNPKSSLLPRGRLETISIESSKNERKAVDAEREYYKIKSARFMRSHIKEIFDCVVSGIIRNGIFIKSLNTGIEGFISKRYFTQRLFFNEKLNSFTDQQNNKVYFMGKKLKARLVSVNIERLYIDFKPADQVELKKII